ncbi:MAG TPA: SDR family oxidoreductase [Thermoanaerobaculia bacterium]|nr:SDR family oxidoreductase [Thermoanaerobaculia bacterium]
MKPTALITGASQGLGRAVARLLARRGYRLVLNARNAEPLQALARELDALAVPGDVSEIAEELAAKAGAIDVLINNASELGPLPMPRLEEYPWDALLRVFQVNAVAPLHLAQLVLPRMKERGSGTILNIISDAGINAYPGWGGYGASKAALLHLSRTLAAELEGTGVRVFAVDPGDMHTEMHRLALGVDVGADLSHLPMPEEVAPMIVRYFDELAEAV